MNNNFLLTNNIIKKILSFFIASSFFLLLTHVAYTQIKSPIEGVWKITEEVTPKGDSTINGNPQPSLLIFTKGYYSMVIVKLERPRAAVEPAKDPKNLTDSEKIARYEQWRPFAAIAGTYDIRGSTLSIRPVVAKTVELMNRKTAINWEFKPEGSDILWLTPIGQSTTEPKIKLTRME